MARNQASAQSSADKSHINEMLLPRLKEGGLIAALALCAYFLLALISYSEGDPGWSGTGHSDVISNLMGRSGAWIADVLYSLVGYSAYLIPLMLAYRAWMIFRERYFSRGFDWVTFAIRVIGLFLVLIGCTALSAISQVEEHTSLPFGYGGLLGQAIADASLHSFNVLGSRLVLLSVFLFGMTIFTDLSWLKLMDKTGEITLLMANRSFNWSAAQWHKWIDKRKAKVVQKQRQLVIEDRKEVEKSRLKPKILPAPKPPQKSERIERERQTRLFDAPVTGELPPLSLLNLADVC